jgi:glycosyltransferase involved in cell wall biosynthesis
MKISVVVPCYNDSKGVPQLYERVSKIFTEQLPGYDYELIFVDDCSPDNTWQEIEKVCTADPVHCKGIQNVKNFGFYRNSFTAMRQGSGDAVFLLFGDLQDPPEYLPEFVQHWENGHKVVLGARGNSYTKPLLVFMRNIYYGLIEKLTDRKVIRGISFYGLFDSSFIDIVRELEDIQPSLSGIVSEFGENVKVVDIIQEESARGKTNVNFWGRFEWAMINLTGYSKIMLRLSTFAGAIIGLFALLFAIFVLLEKIFAWNDLPLGTYALTCGIFFLGAVQLFFLGILGEYILSINNRSMKRPITVIGKRINFDD